MAFLWGWGCGYWSFAGIFWVTFKTEYFLGVYKHSVFFCCCFCVCVGGGGGGEGGRAAEGGGIV